MIKRSGENVSPEEIENELALHDGVAESLVLGVPDAIRTEEVAAVVVAAPGSRPDPAALVEFLADRLARFKLPRYVVVRGEPLPRLAAGKIDRARVVAELDVGVAWDRQRQSNGR
jgi:acyl-CoA synthetase (AMP-forming)/AMP-acid ligase II